MTSPSIFLVAAIAILLLQVHNVSSISEDLEVVLVKIGGSSITHKAERERLDRDALEWFAETISQSASSVHLAPSDTEECGNLDESPTKPNKDLAFVIVHGAGSFGHFSAKDYGLKGQVEEPLSNSTLSLDEKRFRMRGLAETRLSVQTLNRFVVQSLLDHNVNAVGISPCFGIPGLEAHAARQIGPREILENTVRTTVDAGLVPVLHGDACLYGDDGGILSGDTIMEILGTSHWVHHSVFITDVDGVYSEDPRINQDAQLLRNIFVDAESGIITTELDASSSSHSHDVTGGLAVSNGEVKNGRSMLCWHFSNRLLFMY
jgi:isopentenyl phosphate kinase